MSRLGERTLFRLLLDKEQLDILAMEGLESKFLPTADLRPIYEWAIDYYHSGGRKFPLTAEILKAQDYPDNRGKSMYDVLAEYEIIVDEILSEEDPHMDFALEDLKASYVSKELNTWARDAVPTVGAAIGKEKQAVLAAEATKLIGISLDLESRQTRVDLRESGLDILDSFTDRQENNEAHKGIHFGLPEVDEHSYGIHEGELAVMAAWTKVGKSFMLDRVALKEWEAGKTVSLFTLENSIEMTRDRILCLATGIDPDRWSRGKSLDREVESAFEWIQKFEKADNPLYILQPDKSERTAEQIVLKARLLGTESLIIDQLTFMESPNERISRDQQIRESVHTLKSMINSTKDRMPCLLAHQVNRVGYERALDKGYHASYDMAEGAEVERTADWVFSMFQSPEMLQTNKIILQILGSRRSPIKNWEMVWVPQVGSMRILNEYDLPS